MVLLGAGFQKHLSIAAFIIGWGLVEIATILNTTVVCESTAPMPQSDRKTNTGTDAYLNDSLPKYKVSSSHRFYTQQTLIAEQGETSALLNLFRTLGGFSVTYFQVPWATKHGALQTFGCEAAVVAGLFILVVPAMQIKGRALRVSDPVMSGDCYRAESRTYSIDSPCNDM